MAIGVLIDAVEAALFTLFPTQRIALIAIDPEAIDSDTIAVSVIIATINGQPNALTIYAHFTDSPWVLVDTGVIWSIRP
jgi:hypothetical protein